MQKRILSVSLSVTALIHLLAGSAVTQQANLSRDLEPVIVMGVDLSGLDGVPLAELFLYKYDSAAGWQQIPFQIDEKGSIDGGAPDYFVPDDGLLDADDELSFMAKDGGDLAANSWIEDPASQTFGRYQIEVSNPLAAGEANWVYLYRSSSLTTDPNLADYISWSPSANPASPGQDRISSQFYEIGHGENGFPNDLLITQAGGGNGQDIMDRLKFRATIPFLGSSLPLDEDDIQFLASENDSLRIIDGKIRIIRELNASINFLGALPFSSPPLFYYPYSLEFDVRVPTVAGLLTSLNSGRVSLDLNSNASGMNLVSANNSVPGFTVDGTADPVDRTVDNVLPGGNWFYLNGPQGTVVHLFPLGTNVGDTRLLYYEDSNPTPGSDDTGDGQSFGDTGIDIIGNIALPLTMGYRGYFLDSNRSSQVGAEIASYEANKLVTAASNQSFGDVTSVRETGGTELPKSFTLFQNHPNPFNPSTEIRYSIDRTFKGAVILKIYNLLGYELKTLVNEPQTRGSYEVRWDGSDSKGRQVGSGVYIYRLQAGDLLESRKMLLIR